MMLTELAEIIFWFSILAIAHTYLFYPAIIILLSIRKKNNSIIYNSITEMPEISIIMAVRNAEKVIEKKIISIFENTYDINKIKFYIGSDASDDNTDKIILELKNKYPGLLYTRFENRVGKVQIINALEQKANSGILVFTDVHAFLDKRAIENIVKHFFNPDIIVVCGCLKNLKPINKGIAHQENIFMKQEFKLKYAEGKLWGTTIGAYGAFYAIRKTSFSPVPVNFIVDDFYISLKAITKKGKAICEPSAIAYENVSASLKTEFKRKMRISIGNFQNLRILYHVLFSKKLTLSFAFFSHKILRWVSPIFIFFSIISSATLFNKNLFHSIFFIIIMLSLISTIIDYFSRKIEIHVIILRSIAHFYYMNLALLLGMFKFMKGVNTNVWEPTNRE